MPYVSKTTGQSLPLGILCSLTGYLYTQLHVLIRFSQHDLPAYAERELAPCDGVLQARKRTACFLRQCNLWLGIDISCADILFIPFWVFCGDTRQCNRIYMLEVMHALVAGCCILPSFYMMDTISSCSTADTTQRNTTTMCWFNEEKNERYTAAIHDFTTQITLWGRKYQSSRTTQSRLTIW